MRNHYLTILAASFSVLASPGSAQDIPVDPANPDAAAAPADPAQLPPDQQLIHDSWNDEQQAQFRQWPGPVQNYFWTLSPSRQDVFWHLSDSDKMALSNMDDGAAKEAWAMIEQRMAPPPAAAENEVPMPPEN